MNTRTIARHRVNHAAAAQWVQAVSCYRITSTYLVVAVIIAVLLAVT